MAGIKGPQLPHEPSTAPAPLKVPAPVTRGAKQVSGPKRRLQVDADTHDEEHTYTDRHDPDEGHKGRGAAPGGNQAHSQGPESRLAGAFASPGGAGGMSMRATPRQISRHEVRGNGAYGAGQASANPRTLGERAVAAFKNASPERQAKAQAVLRGLWVG